MKNLNVKNNGVAYTKTGFKWYFPVCQRKTYKYLKYWRTTATLFDGYAKLLLDFKRVKMEKYYYIEYSINCPVTKSITNTNCVSDKHPFEWLKVFDGLYSRWKIKDWKEISKEEYELVVKTLGIG